MSNANARTPEEILEYCKWDAELPKKNEANPEYGFADWTVGQNHKLADKARIDLPAMAQRVLELEQKLKEREAINRDEIVAVKTERDNLNHQINAVRNLLTQSYAERDKLASRVAELEKRNRDMNQTFLIDRASWQQERAERDKLAGQVATARAAAKVMAHEDLGLRVAVEAERDKQQEEIKRLMGQVEDLRRSLNERFCIGCGATQNEREREFDLDCPCGDGFMTPESAVRHLLSRWAEAEAERDKLAGQVRELESQLATEQMTVAYLDAQVKGHSLSCSDIAVITTGRHSKLLAETEQAGLLEQTKEALKPVLDKVWEQVKKEEEGGNG